MLTSHCYLPDETTGWKDAHFCVYFPTYLMYFCHLPRTDTPELCISHRKQNKLSVTDEGVVVGGVFGPKEREVTEGLIYMRNKGCHDLK
jgi:hypothetical protein